MNAALALSSLEKPYGKGRQYFEGIVSLLDSRKGSEMNLSELERELKKRGLELMRQLLQEHLDSRNPGLCVEPVVGADGVERLCIRDQQRKVETVFGTVEQSRAGYGHEGVKSLHPSDGELNIPAERYSLEMRRLVAINTAKNCFDEAVETIDKVTGGYIPKRQVEELTQRAAQDFDAFYERRQCNAEQNVQTGPLLVITTDGKGVVMHEQDLREQTRKAAKKSKKKMGTRLSKGEKKNCKRMATVAAVYTIDTFKRRPEDLIAEEGGDTSKLKRPKPEQKRVWASLEKEPHQVIADAFDEAHRRDPNQDKRWVALVDGNNTQIDILKRVAKQRGVNLTIIVDIVHVIEYLWKAGRAFYPESGLQLEGWVRQRLSGVLNGKASLIAGGMRRSATVKKLDPKTREPIDTCAKYLLNKSAYLHYDHYLSHGLPIATGVIEGACRYLVKDRLEITGAKWRLASAEAVLRLRALRASHDFDEYWTFHEACEYKRNHQDLYAGGVVPRTSKTHTPSDRDHLKVIK